MIVKPFEELGSNAEPPGNVSVNSSFGVTVSGTMKPTVMSCFCVRIYPLRFAWHETCGNVCEIVWSANAA